MSTLVIKNLPETLHRQLRHRAKRNHRSVTKETIAVLEAAVKQPTGKPARDALDALFAAGDAMATRGVNFETWAARSRDAWR